MIRLTGRGIGVLGGSIVLGIGGVVLGYPSLTLLGTAAFGSVVAAVLVATRRPHVVVSRQVYPDRVQRGGRAVAQLRVHNTGARWQSEFTALDRVGHGLRSVTVRALPPNGDAVYHYDLPTDVRGRHEVGPLTVHRADPLGLGRSRLTEGDTATLWVHPRVHPIRAFTAGLPRHHHEGRSTDRSLGGSLDLREVREYVPGDEIRHLHWKATARTGQLMVRDYVDPNQPKFTVLLDSRPSRMFEDAVELTASLAAAAAGEGHRCRLVTTCGVDLPTNGAPGAVRELLDLLCLLPPADPGALPLVPDALREGSGGSMVTVLTTMSTSDQSALALLRQRYPGMVAIALGGRRPVDIPGVRSLVAMDAQDAAARWNEVVLG
ncbi:MAG TPA: DUF58 domain-containing protein [Pseudonocardiaceae bacterium]